MDDRKLLSPLYSGLRNTIPPTRFLSSKTPVPPPAERAAIVRVVDHTDRRIRRYIRTKQKLIKLLEEQKQAIIHRAVTRGLDPDVRLKPSGVEWLGEVPEHWEVARLFQLSRVIDPHPSHRNPPLEIDGIPFLGVGDIEIDGTLARIGHRVSEEVFVEQRKRFQIENGDLAIGRVASIGKVIRLRDMRVCFSGRLAILKPLIDSDFLFSALNAPYVVDQISVATDLTTLGVLGLNKLKRLYVIVPPISEQERIATYLRDRTGPTFSGIQQNRLLIRLALEYRTRLIADVVTGKLDVREAAARLADEAGEPEPPDEGKAIGEGNDEWPATPEADADEVEA